MVTMKQDQPERFARLGARRFELRIHALLSQGRAAYLSFPRAKVASGESSLLLNRAVQERLAGWGDSYPDNQAGLEAIRHDDCHDDHYTPPAAQRPQKRWLAGRKEGGGLEKCYGG